MSRTRRVAIQPFALIVLILLSMFAQAQSSASRERLLQLPAQPEMTEAQAPMTLPPGSRVVRNVVYGSDSRQRFDVYLPTHASDAPVIFMVYGGGWRRGDKAASGVIHNKIDRWLPRGFIVISTNYPMLPDTRPLQQAQQVARPLAVAQQDAASWDGDPNGFILAGHSAGAHLVALLTGEPALANAQGAQPWLGTLSLDSASLNVVQIMQGRRLRLYDEAFGTLPSDWLAASPYQQMSGRIVPFLAVCSSQRRDSCPQSRAFVRKAESFGSHANVLEENLRHGEIVVQLGLPSAYTDAVEQFMRTLSPAVARRLDDYVRRIAALPVVISRLKSAR